MALNTRHNVYLRQRGQKQFMIAKFHSRTDAVNYAYEKSVGEFQQPDETLFVTKECGRKKLIAFRQGERV